MIIGLCGKAGSGKDTTADILVKNHGFVKVAFADILKRFCMEVFTFSEEQLWGSSEKRNAPDKRYQRYPPHEKAQRELDAELLHLPAPGPDYLTPRFALQQLGTEWGRTCYPNIWAEYTLRVARTLLFGRLDDCPGAGPVYDAKRGLDWQSMPPRAKGVVISDVRFKNEVEAIRAAGGMVWRVERPGSGLAGAAGAHVSETEQASIPSELLAVTVDNSADPAALERLVATLVSFTKDLKK
jgi:hypothetical protein